MWILKQEAFSKRYDITIYTTHKEFIGCHMKQSEQMHLFI